MLLARPALLFQTSSLAKPLGRVQSAIWRLFCLVLSKMGESDRRPKPGFPILYGNRYPPPCCLFGNRYPGTLASLNFHHP